MADKALEVKMKGELRLLSSRLDSEDNQGVSFQGHVNESSQIGATLDEDGRWIVSRLHYVRARERRH